MPGKCGCHRGSRPLGRDGAVALFRAQQHRQHAHVAGQPFERAAFCTARWHRRRARPRRLLVERRADASKRASAMSAVRLGAGSLVGQQPRRLEIGCDVGHQPSRLLDFAGRRRWPDALRRAQIPGPLDPPLRQSRQAPTAIAACRPALSLHACLKARDSGRRDQRRAQRPPRRSPPRSPRQPPPPSDASFEAIAANLLRQLGGHGRRAIDLGGLAPHHLRQARAARSRAARDSEDSSKVMSPDNREKIGRRRSAVRGSSSGSTRTLPTTDMKLVSPVQRGTRWTCR